jgi:hypothetical protein
MQGSKRRRKNKNKKERKKGKSRVGEETIPI